MLYDRCLTQSPSISVVPIFKLVGFGPLSFLISIACIGINFKGDNDKNYSECLKLIFLNKAVLILFFHQQITRFEKQNLLKSVFLLNFISLNTELQKNINLIHANKITIP